MKKILLFLGMFLFITNVNALTFNVDITNIEDEGNNGTIGSITNIDIPNKTIDAYFQDIGDEVNFSITIANSGDRAGTLREINVTSSNDKIEYTNDLPTNGLAINGNDTNTVTITAKVLEGATKGKTSSQIKITYNYDEGSCPEGEILSSDESMCLCPEGKERNENGICVEPEKPVECAPGEIYNETKKICEKKVVPVPSNPKTLDNIILITLLFIVSGLGIYAVMYKKLNTDKKKIAVGAVTGVVTLSLAFTVLAGVFGLDNLLSAIINPITKNKELVVTVNEEIDLIETWDGECSLHVSELTPDNIFQGGSGTESDPYQVKTAEQLSCFAKSVNNGTTYEGQFIKQIKNIKLNDNLNTRVSDVNADLRGLHVWTAAGDYKLDPAQYFAGTYDGDNHIISGLYITDDSVSPEQSNYKGLFGYAVNATFKNMVLSDVYMVNSESYGYTGALLGYGYENLTLENIKTYGNGNVGNYSAGVVSYFDGNRIGGLSIDGVENNINLYCTGRCSGVIQEVRGIPTSEEPLLVINNTINKGNLSFSADNSDGHSAGVLGALSGSSNVLIENTGNTGNFTFVTRQGSFIGGVSGYSESDKMVLNNCYNTGNFTNTGDTFNAGGNSGGVIGRAMSNDIVATNLYNSGNISYRDTRVNFEGNEHYAYAGVSPLDSIGGVFGRVDSSKLSISNSYNTGDITMYSIYVGGILAKTSGSTNTTIENCYNVGNITSSSFTGGIAGYVRGTISKSYNTGDITIFSGDGSGGLVGQGESNTRLLITNSYNEGDITVTTFGIANQVGGLCGMNCSITNSYNRGNLDFKHQPWSAGGIIGANAGTVSNVYNSGTITIENIVQSSARQLNTMYVGGIYGQSSAISNAYNLGDINAYYNGTHNRGFGISGVSYGETSNSVNTGNITLEINQPYTAQTSIYLAGISDWSNVTNSFNAGTITLDDSKSGQSIYDQIFVSGDYTYKHTVMIGEINASYTSSSTGNKYNTNANNKPFYCTSENWYCTQEKLDAVGTYTSANTPDIISIINGNDAFEIKQGDTLPTLKVFNN